MSNDYAFWKWRGRARISRGLCYLLVAWGAELPEVELLDIDRYRELIAKRFPSWEADDDPLPIFCQLLPTGHDDGSGHGCVLGVDLIDFLRRWTPLGCPGPEDWQRLPFTSGGTSMLEPDGEIAGRWRKMLGLEMP
jgi:hypothetical protein